MHSPVKLSRFVKDKSVETKDDLAKIVRERNTQKDRPLAKDPDPTADKKASVKRVEPPPETPAPPPNDLLSPTASEPSAARPESRDTPPPPDLGPDTGTGSFGRSSRRHRGSVNYAQPNLRVKMRRPTKDLVDAVAAEERERIAKAKDDASRPVRIKREEAPDALPVWKTNVPKESQSIRAEPTSPLENKIRTSESELPDSVITDRRRRTTVPSRIGDENDPSRPTSGASSAIAALTAGTQRPKRHEADKPTSEAEEVGENVQGRAEKPSIFDITGSSPMDSGDNETTEANVEDTANAATRSSRRHSGLPASSEPWKGSFTISRRGERRRETLSSREGEDHTEKRDRLSTRKSVLDMGSAGDEAIMGRGERAASRRRSMMM